jgi:FKBP-type peptidyl-prolyl cis-trans isomerase FkpA
MGKKHPGVEKIGAGRYRRAFPVNICSLSPRFRVHFASRCAATSLFGSLARRTLSQQKEMPMPPVTTPSGLTIEDTVIGQGAAAAAGRGVVVHYAGWLADGTQFDSSKEKQDPFEFTLGKKEVIPGWEEGLRGMKVGGTRRLTIPPQLAYGAEGAGDTIPPNATLTFEVELLAVS